MAQVWVTFEEIQELFTCDPASARNQVAINQWERRRFSDGVTRVLLPPEEAYEFMLDRSQKNELSSKPSHEFDAVMATLRRILGSEASAPLPEASVPTRAPRAARRTVAPFPAASRFVEVVNAA